jgi:rubrerythrin
MKVDEDALKFLNLGIESELSAYVFYKKAIQMLEDPSLKATLEKLAMDEKGHFLTLEDEYDENVRSECWAPYKDIMIKPGLPDMDEELQESHKELLRRVGALRTKRQVLEVALELEVEARDLFAKAAESAKKAEAKAVFEHLRDFEQGHVQIIEKEIAALTE